MERSKILKPHDIIIPLKYIALQNEARTYRELSNEIFISIGEISEAIKRLEYAGLVRKTPQQFYINKRNLWDFILHGVPYVFPARLGSIVLGVPTSYSTFPLKKDIVQQGVMAVWEAPMGSTRGYAVEPLYKNAPQAALQDSKLYAMLALIDAIRLKESRTYTLAVSYLQQILFQNDFNLISQYE